MHQGSEGEELAKAFSKEYEDHLARVDRVIPLWTQAFPKLV
jgi:hypothetical protein